MRSRNLSRKDKYTFWRSSNEDIKVQRLLCVSEQAEGNLEKNWTKQEILISIVHSFSSQHCNQNDNNSQNDDNSPSNRGGGGRGENSVLRRSPSVFAYGTIAIIWIISAIIIIFLLIVIIVVVTFVFNGEFLLSLSSGGSKQAISRAFCRSNQPRPLLVANPPQQDPLDIH